MGTSAKDLFTAGDLAGATAAITTDVRAAPSDVHRRGFLAELLCFAGEFERADKHLDLIIDQAPAAAPNVVLFRQLLRGGEWRRDVFAEGRLPELLAEPSPAVQALLQALIALREDRPADALVLTEEAERLRPRVPGTLNGRPFDDMRDLDDRLAGIFEVLTSTGKYYWIPAERVAEIEARPLEQPRDLLWRRVQMSVAGGPDGEVFLPTVYPEGAVLSDAARLGRLTDFAGGDGAPVLGVGQRSFLVGEESVPASEIETLTFDNPLSA